MFIVAPASSGRFMTVPRKKKKKANGPLSFRRYTNPVYWLVQRSNVDQEALQGA